MKRLFVVAMLVLLGSSALAGDSTSFNFGVRRTQSEAPRDSHSRYERDRYRDDDDDYDDNRYRNDRRIKEAPRALPPAAQVVAPPPAAPPPVVYKPAAAATQSVAAPSAKLAVPPAPPPSAAKAVESTRPPPAPQTSRVSNKAEADADTPIGDWRTEARGVVRITRCGKALCGYILSSSSNDQGEVVLVNMKSKNEEQWSGSVYSQASGDTYYGTMEMKGPNALRVEACALGRFYCSGNDWSRVDVKGESLISSRRASPEPRS